MLPVLALLGSLANAADIPAGETVPQALSIQVGPEGLDAVAALLPSMLPLDTLAVPDTGDSQGFLPLCLGYEFYINNMWVDLQVVDTALIPMNGYMLMDIELLVQINDPTDHFIFFAEALCIGGECDGWVAPFTMNVAAPIAISATGPAGGRVMEATVGEFDVSHNMGGGNWRMDPACVIDELLVVLNFFGSDIVDILMGSLTGDLTGTIEETLNEALLAAALSDSLALGDAEMQYTLEPYDVYHTTDGLEIVMSAAFSADQATCVAADDPGVSYGTQSPVPSMAGNLAGSHVAAHASSDMLNQLFYALYRGGGLCMALGGEDSSLDLGGIALDTSMLALFGGDDFEVLFPDPKPLILQLAPHMAPEAIVDGPNDVGLALTDFEVVFLAELDGRTARAMGASMDLDAGINLAFDDTTGELGIDIVIDEENITATHSGDPMTETVVQEIEQNFAGTMAGLLDTLLPGLVGDALGFAMPTFGDIGVQSLAAQSSGNANDWLGLYVNIGTVSYADPAADGCSGCDSSEGCGCDNGGKSALPWVWAIALIAMRRRVRK